MRLLATLGILATLGTAPQGFAQDTPLLVEGRQTVFQRVLTRPDAQLRDGPDGALIETFTPFEPLYVFARDGDWISVGRSASSGALGWVSAASVVDWKQNIVAAFTPPANRTRQVMFETLDDLNGPLNGLMRHEAVRELQPSWVARIDNDDVPEDEGIISVEPAEHIDIQQNFYLIPILNFVQDRHPLSYEENILMEVATIPLDESTGGAGSPSDYDVGIVFVIDTTSSMDVHFPIVQQEVQQLVSRIEGTDVGDRVNFGVVAFRDDNAGDFAHLDYRVREVLPLARRDSQQAVVDALAGLEDAAQSSPGVSEDSFSAISFALQDVDWSGDGRPFAGKYVVLVTDAAPKLPGQSGATNDLGTYSLTAQDLQTTAEELGIAVMSVHLKTRVAGEANHNLAAEQFSALSQFGGASFYYPIEGGNADALAARTQQLITFFKDDILSAEGQDTQLSPEDTGEELTVARRVMHVRYLGRERGTAAPDIVRSWISRLNPDDPQQVAASFRLLVTRNELATMSELIGEFFNIGNAFQSQEDVEAFHGAIRDAILRISQNPDRIINPNSEREGDVLEFLDDLPYRSQLLRMDIDFFSNNPGQRRVILDGLLSKQRSYQRWMTTPEFWVPLYEGAPDGEWVTLLPIELLP